MVKVTRKILEEIKFLRTNNLYIPLYRFSIKVAPLYKLHPRTVYKYLKMTAVEKNTKGKLSKINKYDFIIKNLETIISTAPHHEFGPKYSFPLTQLCDYIYSYLNIKILPKKIDEYIKKRILSEKISFLEETRQGYYKLTKPC